MDEHSDSQYENSPSNQNRINMQKSMSARGNLILKNMNPDQSKSPHKGDLEPSMTME